MKTAGILLVGILTLCAQLQPAAAAAGGMGECWGARGGCVPPALGALQGWLGLGVPRGASG